MKTIWKYAVKPYMSIEMPAGATILSTQLQGKDVQMWALVDPDAPRTTRMFRVFATGESFDDTGMVYIATFQIDWMVFHLFEQGGKG